MKKSSGYKEEEIIKICLGINKDKSSILKNIEDCKNENFINKYCSFLNEVLIKTNDSEVLEIRKKAIESAKLYIGQKLIIQKISQDLHDNNIPIILLKSAALNENIYRSKSIRPGCDIDILIKDSDYRNFISRISKFMYRYKENIQTGFSGLYEETWVYKNNPKIIVDLHTQISNPIFFNFQKDKIFETSLEHPSYNSPSIRVLSPEYMLINLSLHCFNDGKFNGHSIFDVVNLLNQKEVNINQSISLAEEIGCRRIVEYTLYKAFNILSKKYTNKSKWSHKIKNILYKNSYKEKSYKRRCQQVLGQLILMDNFKKTITTQYEYIKRRISFKTKHS